MVFPVWEGVMDALLWLIGLSASLSIGFGALTRWCLKRGIAVGSTSDPVEPRHLRYRPITPGHFVSSNDQGAFGEALTLMMLAAEGWRPLNGKPGSGPQGIDGIFIRDGETQWQALLVETKTNSSPYHPRQMETEKLCRTLDALYVSCGDEVLGSFYTAIHKGLSEDARWVGRELWRHHLARGVTEIVRLDEMGTACGALQTRQSTGFMEALAISLSELDRKGIYWKRSGSN